MGLMKAFMGSAVSYINDLWEDYIYCDAMDENTLVKKGKKRKSPGAGEKANENVITEGSRIAVNAGQMLLVVENGQIIDFTAEPGGYEYRSKTEPSMFCGDFDEALKVTFHSLKGRFAFGGQAGNDQRVYFINTKEIMNNKFGFGNVPYRDSEFNMTILLQGFGVYSFVIADPLLFYNHISGNVADKYDKSSIAPQLKGELQNAILPVLGDMAERGIHYDKLPGQTEILVELLMEKLEDQWKKERGLEIKSMNFGNILPDEDSIEKIRQLQESRVYSDNKAMLGARYGAASANAMESAAENAAGAVTGFMGMNMAQSAGGVNVAELMKDAPVRQEQKTQQGPNAWTCSCGMVNNFNFCPNCGSKKPEKAVCASCGYEIPAEFAGMKFCPNCGTPRQ